MSGFQGDRVEEWTPPEFALELVRRLRRHKGLSLPPSLRTTLAIPRLLSARYFRTGILVPKDYLDAARLTAAPEDRALVEVVARELIFPRASDEGTGAAPAVAEATTTTHAEENPLAELLDDLSALDLDLSDVESLDQLIDDATDAARVDAFDLFETLYSSAVPTQRALAELALLFGGAGELAAVGATSEALVRAFLRERLLAQVGSLQPSHVLHGCAAGFGDELAHAVSSPWELVGALAGTQREEALAALLADLLNNSDAATQGRAIAFLRPHEVSLSTVSLDDFVNGALARATDLFDYAELLTGLDAYLDPPTGLLESSAVENAHRALDAARKLDGQFGCALREQVLKAWHASLELPPTLETLSELAVDVPLWEALLNEALDRHVIRIRTAINSGSASVGSAEALPDLAIDSSIVAGRLQATGRTAGIETGARLMTEVLCCLERAAHFLPMLDSFLEHKVFPSDSSRVVNHGMSIGVNPEDILDRLGDALAQLRQAILAGDRDAERYRTLIDRVHGLPEELAKECAACAVAASNLEAIAALLAIDLGAAAAHLPEDLVLSCIGYKGIGGGDNLIKQWFSHRSSLNDGLRQRLKTITKEALLDVAFEWIGAGDGSSEQGLIAQSRTRPFAPGDELDAIDLEGTLDALIGAGRQLESVSLEDLVVNEGNRGSALMTVLVDISGSMSGNDLAMCAISILMLLGRLRPDEVALAAFESNTHVLKAADESTDLDEVADRVLDLEATGGTRVDAALRWATEQFVSAQDRDLRLLFLLSDFCFFEEPAELQLHAEQLAWVGAKLLATSHGYANEKTARSLVARLGGRHLKLKDLRTLPELLIAALRDVADGLMR
ncbi:MAG: vWA domain-containing protein [Polyangiaceae bacterium]